MATRKTQGRTGHRSGEGSEARAFAVVVERIESQMTAVLEAVAGSEARLDAKIDAVGARLSDRIAVLEEVTKHSSRELRSLGDEIRGLRHDFDHRTELARLDSLEHRVGTLERRLA